MKEMGKKKRKYGNCLENWKWIDIENTVGEMCKDRKDK